MDGKVQRWTDAVCCTCADRAAWLEDYPHIAINTSEQVVVMHFTKKFPEWHSEIVDTPRPSLWVEQKHVILEQIFILLHTQLIASLARY